MAEVTLKLTIFLRLYYEADKVPKGVELREELLKVAETWATERCDTHECIKYTTAVNVT
ncbi:MAG: hypothetical protein IMY88_01960 [Chloroflexi bacterium]|nr:hypothetical protein [Chloroflexota bacterium]